MSTALAALRPRDDSVAAVRHALDALADERRAAERHLIDVRAARGPALLDPQATTKQIGALEADARDTEILLERLTAIHPGLEQKLAAARVLEQRAEVDRCAEVAEAAIASFREALGEYRELAERIAAICRLDRAAQTAIAAAEHAARAGGQRRIFNPPAFNFAHLADVVVLPSQGGMHWGSPPAPRSPYASTRPVI